VARLALPLTLLLLATLAVPAAAQSEDSGEQSGPAIIPILASSETAVGPNRFLFSLTDPQGGLLAAPDVDVRLSFYDGSADPDAVVFETDSRFLWAIEDVSGLYASTVTFPHAGRWGTRFDATFPDGSTETVRADYDVRETTSTPALGAQAPVIDTPIGADVGGDLSLISTDTDPLARLYDLSIADAVAADAPFVVAFVTPAFCQSATCGPTLEKIKEVALDHPEVNFVHVEPFVMAVQDERLQPLLSEQGSLQPAPWTELWGLRSEPFVVVVAADGSVQAKFEGAIAADEIEEALAAL
jgi:hypothetical protein